MQACEKFVSLAEKKMIFRALTTGGGEHLGTGHWWSCGTCGYVLAVGNCGQPAMTIPCPQCGRMIGAGGNTQHAGDFEAEASRQ